MHIPFNSKFSENAHHEQQQRAPFMLSKFQDNAARKAGQIRGLMIEHHVSGWFRDKYPNSFQYADNHNRWTKFCSHDFKLKTSNRILYIDVAGPKKDGSFGNYELKPKQGVDFHILAKPIGFITWDNVDFSKGFHILGVVTAANFNQQINPKSIMDFKSWINSLELS